MCARAFLRVRECVCTSDHVYRHLRTKAPQCECVRMRARVCMYVHLIMAIDTTEQRLPGVHLDQNAAQAPHVDGLMVGVGVGRASMCVCV